MRAWPSRLRKALALGSCLSLGKTSLPPELGWIAKLWLIAMAFRPSRVLALKISRCLLRQVIINVKWSPTTTQRDWSNILLLYFCWPKGEKRGRLCGCRLHAASVPCWKAQLGFVPHCHVLVSIGLLLCWQQCVGSLFTLVQRERNFFNRLTANESSW